MASTIERLAFALLTYLSMPSATTKSGNRQASSASTRKVSQFGSLRRLRSGMVTVPIQGIAPSRSREGWERGGVYRRPKSVVFASSELNWSSVRSSVPIVGAMASKRMRTRLPS